MVQYFPIVTGSLTVSGSIIATEGILMSGSIASASFAANAATASFVTLAQTASFVTTAQTASFVANAQSASNAVAAQTASYANTFTVAGNLTAQTLVVQTITSSVDFVTGSTRFGTLLSNTHVFSGSVTMNPGGLFVSSSGRVGINNTNPLSQLDVTVLASGARRLLVNYDDSLVTIKSANDSATAESLRVWGDNIYFYTGSAGSELMRLTNTGRVGIGTQTPSGSRLHVFIGNDGGSGTPGVILATSNGANDIVRFQDGTTTVAVVKNDGRFGMGTTNTSTEANLHLGANGASEGGQLVLQKATSYASASHLDNYQNQFRVLSGNDTTSAAERLSLDMTNGNLKVYGTSYLGTNILLSNSSGATSGQFGQTVSQEFGSTSLVLNLATLFPTHTFASRGLSVIIQVLGLSDGSNGTSVLINGYKSISGTWVLNTVSTSQNGSTGVSGVSGSGNTITITFNTTAFGAANITIVNRQ